MQCRKLALSFGIVWFGLGCGRPSELEPDNAGAGGHAGVSSGGAGGGSSSASDAAIGGGTNGAADGSPDGAEEAASDRDANAPVQDGGLPPLPPGAYENSLGMRFVPVAGITVLFSVWETRVRDYEAYAMATNTPVPRPEFPEAPLQPKASISRAQAEAFAVWLTTSEQKTGNLRPNQKYRLPTDPEWDVAIEVGKTGGPYPWGAGFPPPDHFANYEISNDGFEYTAPVGSFPANGLGLYDLAGNLWEWIGEGCTSGGAYLVRGAGWNAHNSPYFELGFHYCFSGDLVGHHNVGFRV